MTLEELGIKPTFLYSANFEEGSSYLDDQYYGLLLPFQVGNDVYLIDTYHITHYGSYDEFLKKRKENVVYSSIPYVYDYYYKHYYKITSKEDLENRFRFSLDLDEFMPCDSDDWADYNYEDKYSRVALWYECRYHTRGYYLIKKSAKKNIKLCVENLMNSIMYENSAPYVKDKSSKKLLDKLVAENPESDYDKERYKKVSKWIKYLEEVEAESEEMFKTIFNNEKQS